MKKMFLLLLTISCLPAAQMRTKAPMASLEGLPIELKQLILLHTSAGPNGVLNIPALAQGITSLAATSKSLHTAINNPQNMLTLLKLLPRAGAKLLAERLPNMPGMKSKEVQTWLNSFELVGGEELYRTVGILDSIDKLLENENIDVNWNKNTYRTSPLMLASITQQTDHLKLLLNAGVDVNQKDTGGETALIKAGKTRCADIVRLLLAAGADPSIKDAKQQTALNHARSTAERYKAHLENIRQSGGAVQPLQLEQLKKMYETVRLLEEAEKAQKEKAARK